MKTTKLKPILNLISKRIFLIILFISCFGVSAYSQNFFSVYAANGTTCSWSKVEAFDASNNSLGVWNTTINAGASSTQIMFCLPQANVLDHFIIVSACGNTTVPLSGTTMCSFLPCNSGVINVSSSPVSCSGNPGQLRIDIF
jgi:hypothetical protein